ISEALGANVTWIPETQGVTMTLGNNSVGLQIGNGSAVVSGNVILLNAPPYIKNGRTMVPLRVISEGLGATVSWDGVNRIVTITLSQ
ncbi:MAG: copper amine oxidase N-terminal domain-containing protein, partial [Caldisericum sp.]|uniref:copper amine oxidase N-terminal domain-containing protein n=1 Tax=Caldisericum sp. TaxID=2499687 RepID=UPI003D10497B